MENKIKTFTVFVTRLLRKRNPLMKNCM